MADANVTRKGKIFEAGEYPDKNYSMTAEEIATAAAAFSAPVNIDIEHMPTALDGQLGQLMSVEARDGVLFGEVAMPEWLDKALEAGGAGRKVSVAWDRPTKTITGLSLVVNPRVSTAALMAAFSAAKPIEEPKQETKKPGFFGRLAALFSTAAAEEEAAEKAAAEAEAARFKDERDEALLAAEKTRLAAEEAQAAAARQRAALFSTEAKTFADGEVAAMRAMPAERDHLELEMLRALTDDHASPAKFNVPGVGETDRAGAIRARQAARPPHEMTRELVSQEGTALMSAEVPTTGQSGNGAVPPERTAQLLSLTALGRAATPKSGK